MIENAIGGLPDRLEPRPRVGVPVLERLEVRAARPAPGEA